MTNPCAFCDHPDARHRTVETIVERWKAGERMLDVLADYGLDADAYELMLAEVTAAEVAERGGAT